MYKDILENKERRWQQIFVNAKQEYVFIIRIYIITFVIFFFVYNNSLYIL